MAKETSVTNNYCKFAIIGGGHIGCALIEGLIRSGIDAKMITVSSPALLHHSKLRKLRVQITQDNKEAARSAQWVFLAVKPMVVSTVLKEIEQSVGKNIIVSLAAGVCIKTLHKYVGKARVVRIMPNMPIAVGRGVIGFFSDNLSKRERVELLRVLSKLGIVAQVKSEDQLDAITLISGCGPGIVSFLVTALAHSARTVGLSTKDANLLAQQTFTGTLEYLTRTGISADKLMRSVATKNGITEAILADLAKHGLTKSFSRAIAVGSMRLKRLKNDYV